MLQVACFGAPRSSSSAWLRKARLPNLFGNMLPKTPVSLPQQVFLLARRQHSNFISAGFPVVVLVGFAAGRLLVCGGASKARPGNYTCYHALVSCNHVGRLCTGDHRVITILPPTVRMWHLKEDGRGIRWNDSSNAKQQCIPFVIVFQDWGYDQHGSWSGCSNHIWARAERFTDWAHELLSGPVDEAVLQGAIAARLQLRKP